MYDVIVVGARCAGSPLAMLLARRGHRVLVVDRARFPSDTLSTHYIHTPGVARLKKWGVLDSVLGTGCPAIVTGRLDINGKVLENSLEGSEIAPFNIAPRRTYLDKVLVDAAREAGAEIREGFFVEDLIHEDGTVAGIIGRDEQGNRTSERARVVVGADGRNSVVAKLVAAPFVERVDPLACGYYGYWAGEFPQSADFRLREDRTLVTFPTNDGAHVVIAAFPPELFKEIKKSPVKHLTEAFDDLPEMASALKEGELKERVLGIGDAESYLRGAWGPGWVLIGDALFHKDPTPADGINDAFREVEYLASALDEGLSGAKEIPEALSGYEELVQASVSRSLPSTVKTSSFAVSLSERVSGVFELAMWRAEEMNRITEEWQ